MMHTPKIDENVTTRITDGLALRLDNLESRREDPKLKAHSQTVWLL
jgi:hypothetical protein